MKFWGKADAETVKWHPLVLHMLDVAAVAVAYGKENRIFSEKWALQLGLAENDFHDILGFFAAIHDLGKFSGEFQWKIPELWILFSTNRKTFDFYVKIFEIVDISPRLLRWRAQGCLSGWPLLFVFLPYYTIFNNFYRIQINLSRVSL